MKKTITTVLNTASMKKTIPTVLCVHISILLLFWGGLNALGVAFFLLMPLIGCIAWLAFQQGKSHQSNINSSPRETRMPSNVPLFRG